MKVINKSSEKGISGVATCKVGEKSFTFVMKDGDHDGEKFSFRQSDLPEDLPEDFSLENGKEYFVSLTADGDELRGVRPARGLFTMRVVDFTRNKDEDFLIIERDGQYGKFSQFVSLLEIQSGKYKGIRVPLYLPLGNKGTPKIQDDGDGNIALVGDISKSRAFAQFYDLCVYGLGDDAEVPYDDDLQTVLGNLLKAFLRKKREFFGLMEKGYIKSLSADDDVADEDDEDEEEKPKNKKSETSKKSAADDEEEDLRD